MSIWNKKEWKTAIVTSSSPLYSALQGIYRSTETESIFYFPKTSIDSGTLRDLESFRVLKSREDEFDQILLAFEPDEEGEAEKAEFIKCFGKANYSEIDTKQNELKSVSQLKVREKAATAYAFRKQAAEEMNRKIQETLSKLGLSARYDYRIFPLLMEVYLRQKAAENVDAYQTVYVVHAKGKGGSDKRAIFQTYDKRICDMENAVVTICEVNKKRISRKAPKFYHTIEFLQDADAGGIRYHQAMTMIEMLYRNRLIPFYRTDSVRITKPMKETIAKSTELAFPTNAFFQYLHEQIKNRELPESCICDKNEANGLCLKHTDAASLFSIYDMAEKEEKKLLEQLIRRQFAVYFEDAIEECYQYTADCKGVSLHGEKSYLVQAGWKTAYGERSEPAGSLSKKEELLVERVEKIPFAEQELMNFQSLCRKLKLFCCGDVYEILRILEVFFHQQKNPWLIIESGYYLLNDEGKTFFANFEGKPQAFSLSVISYLWQLAEDAKDEKISKETFRYLLKEKEDLLAAELQQCMKNK